MASFLFKLVAWAARLLLVLVVAAIVVGVVERSWVHAQWRAAITLAVSSGNARATSLAARVTKEPRVEEVVVDGIPTTVYRPAGSGEHPATLFITGADERGRHHPAVVRLGRGLARAGFVAYVPDLPGLRTGTVRPSVLPRTARLVRDLASRPEVRHHRIALASVSTGASLALLVAERPETRGRISAVAGVAPFADVRTLVRIATTGTYRTADGRIVPATRFRFMQQAVVRSSFSLLPTNGPRGALLATLRDDALAADDPIAALRQAAPLPLGPDAAALLRLVANDDPTRFDSLWQQLPTAARTRLESLSPITHADRLTMPVQLASAPNDKYFPLDESRAIVRAAPHARLTVTRALDHAELAIDAGQLRDLARLDGFLVRWMRDAARD